MKTDLPASKTLPEPSEKVEMMAVEVGWAEDDASWETVEEEAAEEEWVSLVVALVEEACSLEETLVEEEDSV